MKASTVASLVAGLACLTSEVAAAPLRTLVSTPCLDSTANDTTINLQLYYGGPNTVVNLCAGATINLYNSIFFTNTNQTIQTVGLPTTTRRATLNVTGQNLATAVVGNCDFCSNIKLQYVQLNGNRPALGLIDGGAALIEFGGNNAAGQLITNIWAYEPRGWSCLHVAEGNDGNGNPSCYGMSIKNNQIGPSGMSPNQGPQFRKRELDPRAATGSNPPGQWADGISLACGNSIVSGNAVTDATDGGIVLFDAQGSQITGNTITARNRNFLGGINLVDVGPWHGNYSGTVVSGNKLVTDGAMIKIGIAMGTMVWGSYNNTAYRTQNGRVASNSFTTTLNGGYFAYGIASAGMNTTSTFGNTFVGAKFNGAKTPACYPPPQDPPKPGSLYYDPYTTSGSKFQPATVAHTLMFDICVGPLGSANSSPFTRRSWLESLRLRRAQIEARGATEAFNEAVPSRRDTAPMGRTTPSPPTVLPAYYPKATAAGAPSAPSWSF